MISKFAYSRYHYAFYAYIFYLLGQFPANGHLQMAGMRGHPDAAGMVCLQMSSCTSTANGIKQNSAKSYDDVLLGRGPMAVRVCLPQNRDGGRSPEIRVDGAGTNLDYAVETLAQLHRNRGDCELKNQ